MIEHLLDLFYRTTDDYAIILLDREGIVRGWNRGAELTFGFGPDEVIGTPGHAIFVAPDRLAGVPDLELSTAAERGTSSDERWHLRKDGSRFWASGLMIALRDEGALRGYAKVVRDLTEQRRLEEAVRETQRLESVGILAAGVAHDFNNVLTAVAGNVALVRRVISPDSATRAGDLIEEVERAVERATHLVRQLLNYAGKSRRDIQPVDVCRLIADAAAIVRASVSREIVVRTDLPDACPPVQADVAQLQQLVLNLILNAAEAMGDAAGEVFVRVRVRRLDAAESRAYPGFVLGSREYVEIEIRDTGQGMDADTVRRIFDPFFTTKFLGRGLGLAAALGIVRSHGGGIAVESRPGAGSTFRVLIPLEPEPEPAPTDDVVADTARGEGLVLVVDGEPSMRALIQQSVEELGYTVVAAEHGAQAIEMFERVGDQLVLAVLDLALPVLGGPETVAVLQHGRPDLPIVVLTELAADDALGRLGELRISGFVPKPFSPDQLAHAIAAARAGGAAGTGTMQPG